MRILTTTLILHATLILTRFQPGEIASSTELRKPFQRFSRTSLVPNIGNEEAVETAE